MARSMLIVVCDDFTQLSKVRSWGQEQGLTVQAYSTAQWEEGLENPTFRGQVHLEPVSLNAGSAGGAMSNIVPFPKSYAQGDDKRVHTMDELEADAIRNAIQEYRGNLTEAAKALGIGRATLYRKVKQYSIDPSFARTRGTKAA